MRSLPHLRLSKQCRCKAASSSQVPQPERQRSRKPVRSKQSAPAAPDPESQRLPEQELLHELDDYQTLESAWTSMSRHGLRRPLPAAYQQQQQPQTMPQEQLHQEQEQQTAHQQMGGGFFYSNFSDLTHKLQQHRQRRQQQQQQHPSAEPGLLDQLNINYRYAVDEDGKITDMIRTKLAVPAPFQHLALRQPEGRRHQQAGEGSGRSAGSSGTAGRFLGGAGAGYVDLLQEAEQQTQGTPASSQLCLKAFVYCVGHNELFNALWDLDMVDRVEWVQTLKQADVVIHRRPHAKEKQHHYEQFRREAHALGIPFVSINAPTASELRKSLLPVFDLYLGIREPPKSARTRIRL